MSYVRDQKCDECGSRNLTKDEYRGEKHCEDCGACFTDHTLETASSFTQSPQPGDKPELARPTFTPIIPILGDTERTAEDLLWHIPPPVKRESKIEEKKATAKTIVTDYERTLTRVETLHNMIAELEEENPFSPEIENLRDELLDAEADYEDSRKKSKSFAMKLDFGQESSAEDMQNNTQARDWLGLSDFEDEDDLNPDSKSILVKLDKLEHGVARWTAGKDGQGIRSRGFIDGSVLWKNGVPERSLVDDKGRTRIAPRRERIGLEVFIQMVGHGDAFWFFDDFSRMTRMNPKLTSRIIKEDLPVSRAIQSELISMAKRQWHKPVTISEFVRRCARACNTEPMGIDSVSPSLIPLPPENLWEKLGIGPKGEGVTISPRFWFEISVKTPPEVQEEEISDERYYDYFSTEADEEEEEPESSHGKGWHQKWIDSAPEREPSKTRWGYVRRHPFPIMLRHIPIAYYIAQEFWNRRTPNHRLAAKMMLDLIERDLAWCSATVEELDAWWDSVWEQNPDDTKSVTTLRNDQ